VKAWLTGGVSLLAVGVGYAPWFLRNGILTGNPVYPLFNRSFGLDGEIDFGAELYFLTISPGAALLDPDYYWEKFARLFHSGYNFPGIAIAVLVYLFVLRRWRFSESIGPAAKFWRPELTFCLISFLAHLFLTTNLDGRFWVPTLSAFLPFLGEGLSRTFERLKRESPSAKSAIDLLLFALVVICLYNYVGQRLAFFRNFQESPLPILSEDARWDYYARQERGDPNGRLYETLIPKGSIVFGLRFPERVHSVSSDREHVYGRDRKYYRCNRVPLLDPFMESDRTPLAFVRAAGAAGVEYLVIPAKKDPKPENFWAAAAEVGVPVEGGKGRLLRIPNLRTYLESKSNGED
jgi:hypothetical protein